MFLRTWIFIVEGGVCKYGMGKSKKELCVENLELVVLM